VVQINLSARNDLFLGRFRQAYLPAIASFVGSGSARGKKGNDDQARHKDGNTLHNPLLDSVVA